MTDQTHFNRRLARAAKRGDLTRTDLACWFARHYSTIREWEIKPIEPSPKSPASREAYRRLALLEKVIEKDKRFPIPAVLSQRYRRRYVTNLVQDHVERDDRVSQVDTSQRRSESRVPKNSKGHATRVRTDT